MNCLKKKQSFITGAVVMAAASILCKMMSAVFKIPLDQFFLHEEGIAVYQSVYSIYNVFLAICVTGIPIALSSLVAKASEKEGADLCKSTFTAVTLFCAVFSAIIFVWARPIAVFLSGGGEPFAENALRAISPALLFLGMISSVRGYFQGNSNMIPSALSQLGESLTKVVLGITLCGIFVKGGMELGVTGAVIGVTFSAICAAFVLYGFYTKENKTKGSFSSKKVWNVFKLSLPVTLGTFGYAAVMLSDSLTVTNILSANGINGVSRLKLFGYLTRANTVYNLPAAIITAITASIVPIVSAAAARKDEVSLKDNSGKALKTIFYVASPSAFGLMLFAPQIFRLLFSSTNSASLLIFTGILVLILPYVQTTTAMLQTVGMVWSPIVASAVSIALKVLFNFILIPKIGVNGAQFATVLAFMPAFLSNTYMLRKISSLKRDFKEIFIILLCGGVSCTVARLVYSLSGGLGMLVISFGLAAIFYAVLIVLSGSIRINDILKKGETNGK